MDWNGRLVAVTGAGGFIGSHLTERLLSLGAQVRAFAHGKHAYLENAKKRAGDALCVTDGDIRDEAAVRRLIDGADTVFHLAAVTSVAYSYEHPAETIEVNTLGTLRVCEACRAAGVRRLVHTSTAGAYGNAIADAPIGETHPVTACNPYTAGKIGGDFVAQTYHLSYDLPVATIRLFNVYGPRMGRYLIMPTVILQLLDGPDLRLGDLTPIRPFTYVDDIVAAYLAMAEADSAVGEVVHFGTEESVSMADLVNRIARLMKVEYRIVRDAARLRPPKSEIFRVRVDSAKARHMLNWRPVTPLDMGLETTIAWIRAPGYRK